MAEPAIADDVDDHILVEGHPVFERQPGDEQHRFGIIAVHMEDRRLHHLGHIGAIQRRAGIQRIAGGEADLVVDDDMHGAAGAVAAHLRELEGFHVHALAGERGVAVDQHRHHRIERRRFRTGLPAPLHAGAHGTFDHRIDDFQMRGVKRQGQMHRAAGGFHIRGETHVVFHVAGVADPTLALEFLEQLTGRFADDVDQHIQPTPVRHTDDDFLHALSASLLHQLVHHRNQALAAFQGKAFLTDVAGVQVTLQPLGGDQPVQQLLALRRIQLQPGALTLQAFLNPAFLSGLVDVHVLGADGAGVHVADQAENFPQGPLRRRHQRAGVERTVHIGFAQAVVTGVQLRYRRAFAQAQRVQIGGFVTPVAISVNNAQHRGLLFRRCRVEY